MSAYMILRSIILNIVFEELVTCPCPCPCACPKFLGNRARTRARAQARKAANLFFKLFLCTFLFLTGCVVNSGTFEPNIGYSISSRNVEKLPSAFPPLSDEEKLEDWGKELYLGLQFAEELDLYRAITCYKRALYLAPPAYRFQIAYHLVEAYYFGGKYQEAVETYESTYLGDVPLNFGPIKELLLMLYDSYQQIGQCAKAERIYWFLKSLDCSLADQLADYQAILSADFDAMDEEFAGLYLTQAKSVRTAQVLNALLPGAGYLYVGQAKSALTSLIINGLFTWAAYQFFDHGYTAAGLITTSLEMGWYLGGINGGGIAAREWNERLYETQGKDFLIRQRLFPILMFTYAF